MVDDLFSYKTLTEFFTQKVQTSLEAQGARISKEVEFYLVQLLLHFSLSENFFSVDEKGRFTQRPLALKLYDATFAEHEGKRFYHLKSLGDTALYQAGVFYEGLCHQIIDVDYYINMGGQAYSSLANLSTTRSPVERLKEIFAELSENFRELVEVLYLSCESEIVRTDNDVLKLLDRYFKTRSKKAKELLSEQGIFPESLLQTKLVQ